MVHALHYYLKTNGGIRSSGWFQLLLDKFIYISAFGGPLLMLPQVTKIWFEKNASGVSGIYWTGLFLGAILWGTYGFVHRQKPIIVANLLMAFLSGVIILGILFYGTTFN